ncbi:pyrroline-5-carboxylate reductase [Kordiimonas aestuarii]|uniref:pyrroline-5-carboxylate reductase n=1 Tax=Kordiimonas aestuarii TaxID=1005925 RepID=UPI0021D2E660|nr:pyrroline-5-carboxylate reductase [Kordiimonas aestuarii]
MNVLLIGCGKMGGAMLRRWLLNTEHTFTIVDPMAENPPEGAKLLRAEADLGDRRFDMVMVAIKPQMVDDVLPAYRKRIAPGGCAVSIAAGCSMARISKLLGDAPTVRVMPNLPALVGLGATGLFASDSCSDTQRTQVTDLIDIVGKSFWVASEDELDRLTAVSGSGPGYVFQFMHSYIEAAKELGFDDGTARALVLQTITGAAKMATDADETVVDLRNSVTSKKGTTEAGLHALNHEGALDTLLKNTTRAAYNRALELQ